MSLLKDIPSRILPTDMNSLPMSMYQEPVSYPGQITGQVRYSEPILVPGTRELTGKNQDRFITCFNQQFQGNKEIVYLEHEVGINNGSILFAKMVRNLYALIPIINQQGKNFNTISPDQQTTIKKIFFDFRGFKISGAQIVEIPESILPYWFYLEQLYLESRFNEIVSPSHATSGSTEPTT